MKKFSLKPLGESCMHILCKSAFLIGLLMTFCLAACSDDDDDTVTPVFPEKQNIICNAGDTREFTFTANTNWSLASSAIWCKFKTDDLEEFTLSGAAGTQTVTLMVTDDNQKVNNISVAKLELTMGGQTIVIGEITRSKVDYELTIYDAEGNVIDEKTHALVVGYNDFAKFSVKANFRFAATNLPGWVELEGGSMVGAVNQKVNGGLKIIRNESREKYPVVASNENVITFSDEEGRAFRSIKVSYAGMPTDILDLTLPSSNKYDWTVSLDGKTFTQGGGGVAGTGSSNTTFKNRFPFTVKTFNDEYKVVFVEKGNDNNLYLMTSEDEWMSCEDEREDGNIKLKVSEYTPVPGGSTERVGYVLVFTKEEYETIGEDNLEATIIDGEDILYKYEQNNLILQFTQKEIKNNGGDEVTMTAVDGKTTNPIECTSYEGSDASTLKSKYGVTGIVEIKQPSAEATIVTTLFSFINVECFYLKNGQVASIIEPYTDTQVEIDATKANGQDVFLIFTDESGNKQMLIVRISNGGSGGDEVVFTITTNNGQNSVACTSYTSGEFGGADWIKSDFGIVDLFEITEPSQSMDITFIASNISGYVCYDAESFEEKILTEESIADMGNNTLNVWLGDGTEITKSVLLVIDGEDGNKHGLFIHVK